MSNPKRKRRILRSVQIDEVSGVDRPAVEGAGAVLRKSNTMNNHEDIVKEAVGVHVDGQEPLHTADEYEAALLAIARMEQKPSENVAEAMARVARNGNPEVTALLFSADRVRARDAATVGKAAAPSPVAEDAERVAKGAPPTFDKSAYEDEMLSLSKKLARPGEGVCNAFARLAGEGAFDALYQAADVAGERAEMAKAAAGPDDRFFRALENLAKVSRRPDETLEACVSRLLHENPTAREGYAAAHGE